MHDIMRDYIYYARITMVGEVLPAQENAVTLSDEKDEYGIPRAQVRFGYGENDETLSAHAVETCNQILEAAGGKRAFVVLDRAPLMGGTKAMICRISIFVTPLSWSPWEQPTQRKQ